MLTEMLWASSGNTAFFIKVKEVMHMRMRKKKHSRERLDACRALLCEKKDHPIASAEEDFGRKAPMHLEIGCGKGAFACGMAANYPDTCFYAVERVENVMINALERAEAERANRLKDNLRFIIDNADHIEEYFAEGSLDTVYLNFSDPWPKERHAKRRLTYRTYLLKYFKLLKQDGCIRFKTDNVGLFDFTLGELAELGLSPETVTRDLHRSPYAEGNVMTEYETNFSSQGFPIHMLVLNRPSDEKIAQLQKNLL